MHNLSFELGDPDEALVERFNEFVAQHAGKYAFLGSNVRLETYNFDTDDDPEETGYVIEISETIESDNKVHRLTTDYHSHGGSIKKSIETLTQDEHEARKRKIEEFKLEEAVEAALIGDDDTDTVTESLIRGKLRTTQDLVNLSHALSRPGPEELPVDALEVTKLLDNLQAAINPKPSE